MFVTYSPHSDICPIFLQRLQVVVNRLHFGCNVEHCVRVLRIDVQRKRVRYFHRDSCPPANATIFVQTLFAATFPAPARPCYMDVDGRDTTKGVIWTSQPLPELHPAQQRGGDHRENRTKTMARKKMSTKHIVQHADDLSESTVSSGDGDDTEQSRELFPQEHEDFNKFKVVTTAATSGSINGNTIEPLETTATIPAGLVRRERRQRGPTGNRGPDHDRPKSGSETPATSVTGRTHDNRGLSLSSQGARRTTSAPSRRVGQSASGDSVLMSTNGIHPHKPRAGEQRGGSEADRLQQASSNRNGMNSRRHLANGISTTDAVRAGKKHEQFRRSDGARAKLSTSGTLNKEKNGDGRRFQARDGMSGELDGGMESEIDVSSCGDMTISSDEDADDMAYAG